MITAGNPGKAPLVQYELTVIAEHDIGARPAIKGFCGHRAGVAATEHPVGATPAKEGVVAVIRRGQRRNTVGRQEAAVSGTTASGSAPCDARTISKAPPSPAGTR